MDVLKGIVGIGSVALAAALCLWLVFNGFRTGVMKGKRSVARASEPKFFWVMMAIYSAVPAWILSLIVWGISSNH